MKYIFITGGVVSGLGKGIVGSSIAAILKSFGVKVYMKKFDPYLNIDPGTMNPIEHGEVFVTDDGAETDLDLGHYERFIDVNLSKNASISSGKIYEHTLLMERRGQFYGKTVQIVPHITNLIKEEIYTLDADVDVDVVICEIGGTAGDIESQPFIEAIRQVRMEKGIKSVMFIHVALLPFLKITNEYKTKPIQHSFKQLLGLGIQPDIIVTRSETEIEKKLKEKISLFCNINEESVISCPDSESIYFVPQTLYNEKIHEIITSQLEIKITKPNFSWWEKLIKNIKEATNNVKITIVAKYFALKDSYLSVIESLKIAGFATKNNISIEWVDAKKLNIDNYKQELKNSKGILVPGGFGESGIEGKILAAKYARENNIPYLGICLGLQVACVEFARNVLKLSNAASTEVDINTKNPVIDIMNGKDKYNIGGTLRVGGFNTNIKKGTLAYNIYKKNVIRERHRHRYEFNNDYREAFESKGFVFSGIYEEGNLVEIIENPACNFFIASQYHPEFTSRIGKPNPLFKSFVSAVVKYSYK
ncbi:CTP synthase [Spiroplasma endosymbiont of Aspidapion aeneum]|uniref:CTP synthase n=1 Tax=Spiroplasma endosymbiont of Aspidapion aeneum TaxID=3066276 RepID=UPI00313CBC13